MLEDSLMRTEVDVRHITILDSTSLYEILHMVAFRERIKQMGADVMHVAQQ